MIQEAVYFIFYYFVAPFIQAMLPFRLIKILCGYNLPGLGSCQEFM